MSDEHEEKVDGFINRLDSEDYRFDTTNLEHNLLTINCDISDQLACFVTHNMHIHRNKPLLIKLNSYGGNADCGAAIASEILEYPHKVTVKVNGVAYSAAADIMLAGHHVKMTSMGQAMFHMVKLDDIKDRITVASIKVEIAAVEELFKRTAKILLGHRLKMNKKKGKRCTYAQFIKETNAGDWFLDPEQLLELGLIDEIYGPRVKMPKRKERRFGAKKPKGKVKISVEPVQPTPPIKGTPAKQEDLV